MATCAKHVAFEAEHLTQPQCPYCTINATREAVRAWQMRWAKLRYSVENAADWPLQPGFLDRLEENSPVPDILVTPIV